MIELQLVPRPSAAHNLTFTRRPRLQATSIMEAKDERRRLKVMELAQHASAKFTSSNFKEQLLGSREE